MNNVLKTYFVAIYIDGIQKKMFNKISKKPPINPEKNT